MRRRVAFAENQNVIQTLAPDRADEPLREGILPRAVRRREDFLDPHALHSLPKLLAVDLVTVAQEIGGRGVVREGVHDLLGGPVGGGVLGHVEVDDAAAVVSQHDENKEDAQARGWHHEEIEGDHIADMVGEERPPGLRRPGTPLRHEPRDGALGDVDPQPEKFPVNSRGAPQRIGRSHPCHESLDLSIDGWAARDGPGGELGPVLAEAAPLPPQNGVGGHDDESLPPAGPHPRQRDPEESVGPAHLRPGHRPLVDSELVAQGQVLQGDMAVSAAEEGKQSKQAEQESNHRAGIFSGSAPPDQSLGVGRSFGEGQDAALGSWIYRITANAAYQRRRSAARRRDEISLDEILPSFHEDGRYADSIVDWSTEVDDPAVQTELRSVLTSALEELPDHYRAVTILH